MAAKWEKLEGNKGVLTVEVDVKTVNEGLDQAFKKVSKDINIPGFRKGKVPRPLFEKRFGVESLFQDALDFILPESYAKAVEEAEIEPVDRPEIDIEQMEKGKELIFTATVTVKPEVKLGEYKGLEAEILDDTVSDDDVEAEVKTLQERQAELVVKEDGAASDGDTVVIDFEGFVDGEPFEGGQSDNYSLEIGSGSFIPGFEEQLIGVKSGEEKEVQVSFPEEYHAAELAGKEATFKVKLHEIKAKELPELDDEFAKDVDEEGETLEELKANIKKRLTDEKKNAAEQQLRNSLVEKAAENAEIDVPEAMVNNEMDQMMQEFEQRLQMQGMNLDLYFQFSGQNEEELRSQMKEDAEQRVKTSLTLEAIAKAENLEVDDEAVDKEMDKMAEMYKMEVDEVKKIMSANMNSLKADLKMQKAIDVLVENSKTNA
ncbi:trigger factor [Bacillus sp. J14TS2]|uniref:trigger factor n=1 Tax=Bacillus sp. J14TS2 TaxID=2807188 RepID=UPI001B00E902|nr:trigger factor [Bacillus sp. J14TS2]GIN71099.1 trigger factor [Bacillus sp. J14TS2]